MGARDPQEHAVNCPVRGGSPRQYRGTYQGSVLVGFLTTSGGTDAGDEGNSGKCDGVDSGARPLQASPPW